jgi:RHS repeat-associated protein
MNYASSQTNRAWQVVAYFARPLKNVIKTESRQAGSLWTAALRTTTELLNLAKGDLMRSIETYPNVTKLERLYRWRNYWRTMDSDLQLQKWTAAEAEAAFNEPDSVTRDTWLFYEYTDPNDVGPDGIQSDFMTVDQDDRDMVMLTFPGSPPHFGLAASKELLDISDGASISLSKVNLTYQEVTSFSRGLPLTRTTFGRSGLRSNSESYTYDNLTMSDILLSSKTMSSGSKLLYRYRGAGLAELPELIQDTKTTATLVTDVSLGNDRIHKDVSVLLGNTASLFNHLPTSQVTELRKPTTIGGTSLFRIATSSAYDVMGNILDRIDENGYLSRFSYDGIGRLLTAWLPLDFSDPDATNFDPLPYDADSTDRNYLVTGQLYDNHLWKQLICNSQSDLAPEVRDINPSQLLQYPKDLILFDPLESSDGIRFVLGSRELGSPDCSMTRECVNNSQPVIAPGPTEFCRFFVQTARYPAFRGNIHYNRSEHINIRSAELHVQLSRLSDDAMDCFPINIAIRDTNGAVLQSWTNYLVNCISIDTVSTSGGTQLMGLSNNGAPRDKQYDLVFQLDVATLGLETRHRQDPDFTELTVEVSTTEDAVGIAYFAGANIIVQGDFVSVDRVSYTDFTLGFRYLDDDQRKAAVYSKIDDRSTTQDDTRYPSLSNYVVYPRHAKRRVTFTTDDLVRYDERGFNKDQMRLLATDILPPSNKSMLVYDGAGKLVVTSNPLNLETQTSFDAIGRVTETEQGLILRGVNPTSISTQVTPSKDSGSKVTTTHSRVQRSSLVCFSPQQLSRLGNVVDVEQVDILEDAASRTSLKVYDERDRVKFSVDGYVAAQTDQPDQNLITEYFYDILDRIVQVVNPAGQLIRYTYDDFSNVASTEQVDMGKVDYAYDRHGRLRFSQTAEQRQCAAVLMRQYDDLGRPTIIGEARINSLLQNQGQRVIDFLNPDRMNIADDGLSHDPTINPTTFTVPTQPVPSVYTAIPFAPCAGCSDGALVTITPPCAELTARSSSSVFNPAESPLGLVINKPAAMHAVTTTNANEHDFENISTHPEFVLQALWYDELPINIGAIWGGSPQPWVWDAMASTGKVRNLVARPSIIAYRTHGGQPFHYIVHSYDERGRVECILRLTENLGFDAVYYSYNSMNKVTSVHTVDARGQHATFYGYDEEGRVFRMWTATSNQGFSPSMKPRKPVLVSRPNDGAPGAEFTYNLLNAVNNVEYPLVNMTTTHTYNDAGMLLRSTTTMQGSAQTLHDEALKYGRSGLIEEKYTREGAQWLPDIYWYDQVGRLAEASSTFGLPFYAQYNYDRVGNRLKSDIYESNGDNTPLKYTHTPSGNQLMRVAVEPLPIGQPQRFLDEMTYDPDGSLITRVKNRTEDGWRQQKIESFAYDPFNLIHIYNVQAAATSVAAAGCAPDATQAPVNQWHYRFGPLQEREQKRQYLTSRADSTLAWVYTLLGADGKQLATYNGLQGALCGGTPATLQIWPVEFNSYGPSNTRLITRANGRTEYVVSDYLGSTRQLINDEGQTLQKLSHRPFGITATSQGSGARTSYIGREHENETDLGFFGVRLYEPEYGRFLSTDVLWGSYAHVQPYQYSFNQPVSQIDAGGKWVEAKTQQAQDAVRNSVPSCFHDAVTFNKDGILNAGPLVEAANGQDSESNIANLAGLATHADGVEIMVLQPKEIIEVSQFSSNGEEKSLDYSFEARNAGRPPSNQAVGETLPGKFFSGLPDVPTGQDLSHSTNENTKVVLAGGRSDAGVTAAHEFIHVKFLFLHAGGFTDGWRHGNQKVEEAILKAEAEATK